MLADFRRADEDSWGFWLSYNFGSRRFKALEGLSFFGRVARGVNARDPDELTSLPDRNAYDITFDYRPFDRIGFYTFFRYWDIDDSETTVGFISGAAAFTALEPRNQTVEAGLGISYKF